MLRKMLLFLLSLMLLFSCAAAEEESAVNPFIGVWEPLYYIEADQARTPEESAQDPILFTFTEEALELLFHDGSTKTSYVQDGAVCTVGDITYTLAHEDLIVGNVDSLSFLLVRVDPMMLNNPFIGTWIPLCAVQNGTIADIGDISENAAAVFSADGVQIIDGSDAEMYTCVYADGTCTIMEPDGTYFVVCTISEDGLLHMTSSDDETMKVICVREDEVVPEEISRFFGTWREVAVMTADGLYTEQTPLAFRGNNQLLFSYEFTRASMLQHWLELDLGTEPPPMLCTYTGGACVIGYDDGDAVFSIDLNGLMTVQWANGTTSWCIRVEEKPDETLSASAKGLLSDVTVTITRSGDGVITAITVDASGETEAIARPCTEDAFLSQFIGRSGPFHDIDVIAGATFTSRAIIEAVNSLYPAE